MATNENNVDSQSYIGNDTKASVSSNHKDHNEHESSDQRVHPRPDVFCSQAWSDGAFLHKINGRSQSTGAQQ